MGGDLYGIAFFEGLQLAAGGMVFAVVFVVLVGRWIIGDEDAIGFCLRAGILVALFVIAVKRFPTIWFWVMVPLAVVPMVDVWWGGGFSSFLLRRARRRQLGKAMADVAEQPANPILRVRYARALLESDQLETGVAELERALKLADAGSKQLVADMAAEARQEFLSFCPTCQSPNTEAAKACRRCLRPYSRSPFLRLALWMARPVLRRRRHA